MLMRNVGLARARGFSSVLVLALASLGLSACGGGKGGAGPAAQTPGSRVYLQNCIGCHGPTGQGMGMQPALPGSATVNGDPAVLAAWVMFGVRPATTPAGKYPPMMPQFTYLKDDELAAVLTHVRTSWGNTAAPVTVAEVAAARAAHAAP
jgi:mono/diheme cytochrome c family protein